MKTLTLALTDLEYTSLEELAQREQLPLSAYVVHSLNELTAYDSLWDEEVFTEDDFATIANLLASDTGINFTSAL